MTDKRRLSRCMRDQVVRLAATSDVLIQTWRAAPPEYLVKR